MAVLAAVCGCRAPLDNIQVALERHRAAVTELPQEERAYLIPSGEPIGSEQARLPPGEVLDLKTARAIAVRANPDVHAARARLESAVVRIAEARSRYYPTLVFTHDSSRTFQTPASRNRLNTALQPTPTVPTDVDTNTFAVTTLINALRLPLFAADFGGGNRNSFSEHSTALTLSWTVFDGFVREAQLLAAKHAYGASRAALEDVGRLIVQAVDAAYYKVQLAEEQIAIAEADEEFSTEQLTETEKLRAAGRATRTDVDNFRVRVLAAQAQVTAAVGQRETGRVVLAELMGMPDVVLPSDLALSPLADETDEEMTLPAADPWIERALQNRPDVRQLESLLESGRERVRAVRGQYYPTVAASGSWGFDRSSNLHYRNDDQSSAAAIEFRWELFTGGRRQARVREAESARAETAAILKRRRLAVQAEVRRAIIDVENAQRQIPLQRETLATARGNRRIVQAGYVAGKETLNRLNEAQRDFLTAEANLARARIRLREAWSDLNAAAATYGETARTEPASPGPAPDETVRDKSGGTEVGQVVLPATPGGSPAAREWQVNVPMARNNDLPHGFLAPAGFVTGPAPPGKGAQVAIL